MCGILTGNNVAKAADMRAMTEVIRRCGPDDASSSETRDCSRIKLRHLLF